MAGSPTPHRRWLATLQVRAGKHPSGLFHLNILPIPPRTGGPVNFADWLAGITEPIAAMIAYLRGQDGDLCP